MIEVPSWLRIIVATILFVSIWAAVVAIEQVGLDHTLSKIQPWQGLIGAGLALVAAIWTIQTMRSESVASDRRHEEHLKRKRLAARSQMPDALRGMTQYVHDVAAFLVGQADSLPGAPQEHLAILKRAIEYIDDKQAAQTFSLVSWYQVHRARIEGGEIDADYIQTDRIYETIVLYAYTNRLYEYARNKTYLSEESQITPEELASASSLFTDANLNEEKGYDKKRLALFMSNGHAR